MDTTQLENRIRELENQMMEHYHNGIVGRRIDITQTVGFLKTVTVASELTVILASFPKKLTDQLFIDTTTATKKLYVYDAVGNVWRSTVLT